MTETMHQRLIIDLAKCDRCESCGVQCSYYDRPHAGDHGMLLLREQATFAVVCRRCRHASCIEACPFEALERQDELQCKYTGGTVLHLYMGEGISSGEACKRLVQRALGNFKLPYITITPLFSICPVHGYLDGEHEYCPRCDEELLKTLNTKENEHDDHPHH